MPETSSLFLLLIVAALVFSPVAVAQDLSSDSWEGPFFFIQMADPQIGYHAVGEADEKKNELEKTEQPAAKAPYKETALFTKAIQHASRLKPAFVIICGDLTQNIGNSDQIEVFKKVTQLLDESIPLYLVSGNCDVGRYPTGKSIEKYQLNFGKNWYSFQHRGTMSIVLNTPIICNPEKVTLALNNQRIWLEEQLEAAVSQKPKHVFIFQHHPVIKNNINENDNYTNFPMNARKDYLDLFLKYDVRAIFSGHLHRNILSKHESIELVTSGPVCKAKSENPEHSGIRIVKVFEEHIKHTYYPLDDVPAKIILNE